MRRLFVPGYYSGFSNNKMSLDIAIVLAHLTGRVLVPYRFRLPRRHRWTCRPTGGSSRCWFRNSSIFLFPTRTSTFSRPGSPCRARSRVPGHRCSNPSCASPRSLPTDDARFRSFRNGRRYVYAFSEQQEARRPAHRTEALGHYSYFFYLDDERRRQVVDLMRRLRPKRPYLAVADHIAASLGPFNAIHLRRGDFLTNELTREKITRTSSLSGEEIVANLASRMLRDDPLVICTDGSPDEEIFGPIQRYFRETIFLDRYLCESASVRDMIAQLPGTTRVSWRCSPSLWRARHGSLPARCSARSPR